METLANLKAERARLQNIVQAMARRGLKTEDAERNRLRRQINQINREIAKRRAPWE